MTLAKYRTAFKPSKAKDDPTDAELALELMLRYTSTSLQVDKDCVQVLARWKTI